MAAATRKRINVSEEQVVEQWERLVGRELTTVAGEPLKVVYPGRANRGSGPDYRDAVVIMNRSSVVKGDVECHVKSSDWYGHGHDGDSEYDRVVLHVVAQHEVEVVTLLRSGASAPILSLPRDLQMLAYRSLPCLGSGREKDSQRLCGLLQVAGEQRFRQKADSLEGESWRVGGGEVLWRGVMRGLGFSGNVKPFEELARMMPLDLLERGRLGRSLSLKQACLLGVAGLLPSQRWGNGFDGGEETSRWEEIWRVEGRGAATMSHSDWHLSQVYPNNRPVRRIVAAACLLQRHHENGLLEGVLQLVREAPESQGERWLEDGLMVLASGCWRGHRKVGVETGKPALVGRSKAGEILVNAILPFAFGWGRLAGDPALREKAMRLYSGYPRLPDNAITRHMARQLCWEDRHKLTACQQQGLIHIFRTYCREGECCGCPVPRRS